MEPSHEIFDVVRAGDTARLQALLAADPGLANLRNERGHTPVLLAQYHHREDAVRVLLAAEPELDIFDAASVDRVARVAEWLDRDPSLLNAHSQDGFSPLSLAAFFGHAATVQMLLGRGADPKLQNDKGISAIGFAAKAGRHDMLKLLKGQGSA